MIQIKPVHLDLLKGASAPDHKPVMIGGECSPATAKWGKQSQWSEFLKLTWLEEFFFILNEILATF